mmetsp:Transcript_31834/g.49782  ORF Transcript_31834/g.49782 Transcript_31834/m.49782 type:complete len:116 (-) Transcript_31834:459-806(-)
MGKVTHWASKVEDQIESLKRSELAPFGIVVCDANMDARDTAKNLVLPMADFMSPGAVLVLTLKLPRRKPNMKPTSVASRRFNEVKEVLGAKFKEFRLEWLFGNSKNERTVLCLKA